ncbi:MAG: leucine-rich repeat domain-containing protein [Candidatus Thorarchaeota archaeon]
MDIEYLPEDVKKELYEELNSILTNYNLKPKLDYLIGPLNRPKERRSRLEEILSGFKLHWIRIDLQEGGYRFREVDIELIMKLIEKLKNKELSIKLNYIKSLEEKGRDIYVDWEGKKFYEYENRINELSRYDLSILKYLESVMEREFFLLNVSEKSEMAVSINDRKITGLSILARYRAEKNKLKTIPSLIFNFPFLEALNLRWNEISILPNEINTFSHLKNFYFSGNKIKIIPSTLYTMKTIEELDLSSNLIESISPSIKNLKKLRYLELNNNKLSDIPEEVFSLKSLKRLLLIKNDIQELSPTINNLEKLEGFSFGNFNVKSLPEELSQIKTLRTLELEINDSSHLPESIGELSSLIRLWLTVENFNGLPPSIENLDKLERLWISSEKGKILPRELTKLKSLSKIYLWGDITKNLFNGYKPDAQSKEVLKILREKEVELIIP